MKDNEPVIHSGPHQQQFRRRETGRATHGILFEGETRMKAIEVVGTLEEGRRVRLDEPLPPDVVGRVRLIILVDEDEPSDRDWLRGATQGGAFDFLNAPEEDRYTLRDGKPFDDAR
jgi:hypothetical protein